MSFLPSPTDFGRITRQSVFQSWLNTHLLNRIAEAYAKFPAKQKNETEPFESLGLGLGVPFMKALQRAFPKVKTPTHIIRKTGTGMGSGKPQVCFFKYIFDLVFVLNSSG